MTLVFVLLVLTFPAITVALLQISGFSIMRLGVIQFTLVNLLFFGFLGTIPLFFGWDEYRVNMGVNDQHIMFLVMLFSGITMLLFVMGAVFAKTVFHAPATLNLFARPRLNEKEILFLIFFLILVLIVLAVYLLKISRVALFVALTETAHEADIVRSMMTNGFPGKYHWYSLFMHDVSNVITFSFFSAYLLAKKRFYLILFVLSFVVSSFAALMTTEKGPFAWLLIGLFISYVAIKHNGRYPLRALILFFSFVLAIVAIIYVYVVGNSDIIIAFGNVLSRTFAGSIQPAYHYLEFFPNQQDFLLGRSFPNPGGLLPFQPYLLTHEIMDWVDPGGIETDIVGSMPTIFWGEAYANYGYIGIVVVPFLVGFTLFVIDFYFSSLVDTPLKVGAYTWLVLHYSSIANTGFSDFVLDLRMVLIVLMVVFIILLSNGFKIVFKNVSYG